MLIAAFLAIPLWQVVPAYVIIGVMWALAYLPRSITLQARAYAAWRDKQTYGRPLQDVLALETSHKNRTIAPDDYLKRRDYASFTEQSILRGFIVNIAFWPLRMVEKLLFDILHSTFVWVWELLGDFWSKLIVPLARAIGRAVRALWRGVCRFFNWLGHVIDAVWDRLVVPVWRAVHRYVRALWYDILVPMYTWVYRYVTTIYKSIIQRANREAIADLAALNKAASKDLAK